MNIIDIICFALIVLVAFFGVIKGFFSVLIRFVAYAVSFFAAKLVSAPVADLVYARFIKEGVLTRLSRLLPEGSVSGGIDRLKETLFEALPQNTVQIIRFFHLDSLISSSGSAEETLTVAQIEQNYVMPLLLKILTVAAFIAVFVLLSLILRFVAEILDKALFKKKKGLLSTTNKILGGVLGLIQGAVPVAVVCLLLNMLAPVLNKPAFTTLVENSMLCGFAAKFIA
ncbi:MAG: CvpA family protein [Clostridia bacterium]|nr:CvpA family protein [Clostridia bacterium]